MGLHDYKHDCPLGFRRNEEFNAWSGGVAKNQSNLQNGDKLEARGGIEPPIKVLQTFALPLGDRALVQHPHD
jgi:hypothetical protein